LTLEPFLAINPHDAQSKLPSDVSELKRFEGSLGTDENIYFYLIELVLKPE
jgi:hypothetical protein